VTKGLWWKYIAAVQSINEVRFMKLKVTRHFYNMLYQILQINYFLFHFNRTNLSVYFLILNMNMLCMLHFSWKCRKLIDQGKFKICKLLSQSLSF